MFFGLSKMKGITNEMLLEEVSGLPTRQCATLATPEPAQKRALKSTNPAANGVAARH